MGARDRAGGLAGRRAGGPALSEAASAGRRPDSLRGAGDPGLSSIRRRTAGGLLLGDPRPFSDRRRPDGHGGWRYPGLRLAFLAPAVVLGLAGLAGPVAAQEQLVAACPSSGPGQVPACVLLAQSAAIAQPRLALAATGGNPLPGSASTLGMRIAATPRVAVQLRAGGARATFPRAGGGTGGSVLLGSLDLEGAIGLLRGLSPAPTVGGVGSLDLVASLGILQGPGSGFSGSPATGAIGARLGIMRESFTTPGVTLSALYRRVGATTLGSVDTGTVRLAHVNDLSLRAAVGKRLMSLGTSAGLGWDRVSSEATIRPPTCTSCTLVFTTPVTAGLSQSRVNGFADLTWTSLVFTATAEVGWQRGGSPATASPATGAEDLVRKGALFGSLALRLTI